MQKYYSNENLVLGNIYPATDSGLKLHELKTLIAAGGARVSIRTGHTKDTMNFFCITFNRTYENVEGEHFKPYELKTQRGQTKWYKSLAALRKDLEQLGVNDSWVNPLAFHFHSSVYWPDSDI